MVHLGLTPQAIHNLGGYKVQGKTEMVAKQLLEDVYCLQEIGYFALVLGPVLLPMVKYWYGKIC